MAHCLYYPMGEERCRCGSLTARLYLCRNCGADYLKLTGDPQQGPLSVKDRSPKTDPQEEWMVYDYQRLEKSALEEEMEGDEAEEAPRGDKKHRPGLMGGRKVLHGSLDRETLDFSPDASTYGWKVLLLPRRNRCLCCGGSAGSRYVITPVSLGTSAAMKVLAEGVVEALHEANQNRAGHDGKERILIFSDSRQDAAHQARFILFAGRYDRMRRRVYQLLKDEGPLAIQRLVELLGERAVKEKDNPHLPDQDDPWLTQSTLDRVQAWEEAPLLDDISVNAGYRATLVNVGLVGVGYHRLTEYIDAKGKDLASSLGLSPENFAYTCRSLLDEMRVRGALSREMLRYHPICVSCPSHIKAADWERRIRAPKGYAAGESGEPCAFLDKNEVPSGITCYNPWHRSGVGGKKPSLQRIFEHLLQQLGTVEPRPEHLVDTLKFLQAGDFITASVLCGFKDKRKLLQVQAEAVRLYPVEERERCRCELCGRFIAGAWANRPCPRCDGILAVWPDSRIAGQRMVRRIKSPRTVPLVAGEHTAQVPHGEREHLERNFKEAPGVSKVNILACSPTLEMGIDVGGLDAVALRNIPPRPDNYAQRGGRAGRRSRIGLVLGYASNAPHDRYFFDRPTEMIRGEIPAPLFNLSNRDVLIRHLNAIAFGAASPGLKGKMLEYVSPQGEVKSEAVEELIAAVSAQFEYTLGVVRQGFEPEILAATGLDEDGLRAALGRLPARIQEVIARTARQVKELRKPLKIFAADLQFRQAGNRAATLAARLLGIAGEKADQEHGDDRCAGYPLRRFAEFGVLPGYEFPTEPSTLRLLGDEHEEDPLTVARRFGLVQFQPDAYVFARSKRWKVIGLDTASPWNPQTDGGLWYYRICRNCRLSFAKDHPRCPRCGDDMPACIYPAAELAGFLARQEESPILDEEDRYGIPNFLQIHPQWDGEVVSRWTTAPGWGLCLTRRETVQWINEGFPPRPKDLENQVPILHGEARGYLLCTFCGHTLHLPEPKPKKARGRPKARKDEGQDHPFGHSAQCPQRSVQPAPFALTTSAPCEILRLMAPVPDSFPPEQLLRWGLSLGYSLRIGIRRVYMLEGHEIDFELEGPWLNRGENKHTQVALSFLDPSLGGTGYLARIAAEFHSVARRALEHLSHQECESSCYRCLKSYQNQRYHHLLEWPLVIPHMENLAQSAPCPLSSQSVDGSDPRPWLEAYQAGLGSPLELKFWKLFEKYGFTPHKQLPIALKEGDRPISIADFAVPEKRLAIYIDSAAFHTGSNLRRDRFIREKLSQAVPPWHIVALTANDLRRRKKLVEWLKDYAT